MRTSLRQLLLRVLLPLLLIQLVAACSSIPVLGPATERSALQHQRAESAHQDLENLASIDTLIRLDNKWLADEIKSRIQTQALSSATYEIQNLNLSFSRQIIILESIFNVQTESGKNITAEVSGDIQLDFDGANLVWLLRFKDIQINSGGFLHNDQDSPPPGPEESLELLQSINSDIAAPLIQQAANRIPLNAMPLGIIELGAALPGFSESQATKSHSLGGRFMVAGIASLIESSVTSIAVDLVFIPEIANCPAGISVSRASFTNKIVSREPVGVVNHLGGTLQARYFFSEVSGVKQPISITHYWFADGVPVTSEELPVGVSARWRTWSAKGDASDDAERWEVLVVEKQTGCILYADSLRALEPFEADTKAEPALARQSFSVLKDYFNERTKDFSIHDERPDIALIEARRPFVRETLQDAMNGVSVAATFDGKSLLGQDFSAQLKTFDPQGIVCAKRQCPAPPACKADLTECKKLRDTRECTSCAFRNPLNNRCVSETTDPMCEASRNRQNAEYESVYANCVATAEEARQTCEQLAMQVTQNCLDDPDIKTSLCEAIKADLLTSQATGSLARVSAQTHASGSLVVDFSNFRIEGDLQSFKMDMRLVSDLQLEGELEFTPRRDASPLAECISGWNSMFASRVTAPPAVTDLMSPLVETGDSLTARWSGFGLSYGISPAPLEAAFIEQPQLLANCHIGLQPQQVNEAISDDETGFFNATLQLEIQPLPVVITLTEASVLLGGNTYTATGRLSDRFLRFDIEE